MHTKRGLLICAIIHTISIKTNFKNKLMKQPIRFSLIGLRHIGKRHADSLYYQTNLKTR